MYKSATLYICTNFFYIIEFALQNTGWFVKRFLGSVKNKKGYKFTTWGNPIIIMGCESTI